jgi:hypothetical protein
MARVYGAKERRCGHCGAPIVPGLAVCNYCRHAYVGAPPGPKCPKCAAVNVAGSMACGRCRIPMARSCIFCGAASPLDASACRHCHEAFAGAVERKQQREASYKQHQYMQLANTGIQAAGVVIASGAATGLLGSVGSLLGSIVDAAGD